MQTSPFKATRVTTAAHPDRNPVFQAEIRMENKDGLVLLLSRIPGNDIAQFYRPTSKEHAKQPFELKDIGVYFEPRTFLLTEEGELPMSEGKPKDKKNGNPAPKSANKQK